MFERRVLPYAEAGYGYPESGQTVINVTDGKLLRLLVDDEPFDVRYGELRSHERILDFRTGTLSREAEWTAPTGRTVRVSSTRLVSFTQRALAAICYEVTPVDGPARLVLQSELVAERAAAGDQRRPARLRQPRLAAGTRPAPGRRCPREPGARDQAELSAAWPRPWTTNWTRRSRWTSGRR